MPGAWVCLQRVFFAFAVALPFLAAVQVSQALADKPSSAQEVGQVPAVAPYHAKSVQGTSAKNAAIKAVRYINCRALFGAGSFSNPLRVGLIRGITVVYGCPGLTSGRGFNVRYYMFTTTYQAGVGSAIGTRFILRPGAISAVHPRLALTNGITLRTSSVHGFWVRNPPVLYRYLPVQGLFAGTYIFGAEKLDSPLRSLRTPDFDIVFYL
jgi:hypothetical protein